MKKQKKNITTNFEQLADKQVGAIYLLMSLFLTVAYALEYYADFFEDFDKEKESKDIFRENIKKLKKKYGLLNHM